MNGLNSDKKRPLVHCLHPTEAWICGTKFAKDGVLSPRLVFSSTEAMQYFANIGCLHLMEQHKIAVKCGKCAVCQVEKRKHWSTRLAHEASMYKDCAFVTLTYNQLHVPVTDFRAMEDDDKAFDRGHGVLPEKTLFPSDVQKFMKRLRRHLEYIPKKKKTISYRGREIARDNCRIRYFCCGEYGSKTHRPHYHILIFGWKPSDLKFLKLVNGRPVYTSEQIENCWTMRDPDGVKRKIGFCSVCDVNPFVAKYVARYVTKKMQRLEDGRSKYVVPEFCLQSVRNGGIGAPWFDKFGENAAKKGLCTYRAGDRIVKAGLPPYYMRRLRQTNQPLYIQVRDQRIDFVKRHHLTLEMALQQVQETSAFVLAKHHEALYYAQREHF